MGKQGKDPYDLHSDSHHLFSLICYRHVFTCDFTLVVIILIMIISLVITILRLEESERGDWPRNYFKVVFNRHQRASPNYCSLPSCKSSSCGILSKKATSLVQNNTLVLDGLVDAIKSRGKHLKQITKCKHQYSRWLFKACSLLWINLDRIQNDL